MGGNKKTQLNVEPNIMNISASFSFIPLMASKEMIF